MIFLIIEILGVLAFIACIVFYVCFPVERDRFLFGNDSWMGSLSFSCVIVAGLILTLSFGNHLSHLAGGYHVNPDELVNWDDTGDEDDADFSESNFFAIISQFADPGNIPSSHGSARKYALLLAVLGIFCLSGLVMSSFVTLLTKKSERWKQGMIHYDRFFNRYVVIIGVNEQTATIIKQSLLRKDVKYVLVQTRQTVEEAREKLNLNLDRSEEKRVVFYYAERTSKEDIEALRMEKSVEAYVLGEDMECDNEEDHDAFNINCLEHISSYVKHYNENLLEEGVALPRRLRCHVSFEYQSTFTAFKSAHIYQNLDKILEFIPFNVHEIWAKKVLVDNFAVVPKEKKGEFDVQKYYPLDSYIPRGLSGDKDETSKRLFITKDNVEENAKAVHVIVLGMNQMGTAFALQAAIQAHYPNFKYDHNLRTTITFIDDHAVDEGNYFKGRFESLFGLCRSRFLVCGKDRLDYSKSEESFNTPENDPLLKPGNVYHYLNEDSGNFMDVQWEFIQGNVASSEVKEYLKDVVLDQHKTTTIAICFNHPQRSIATALYLPGVVFRFANQVLVYQRNSFDMLNKVADGEKEWKRYANLFPFGMIESSYTGDTLDNSLASLQNYLFSKSSEIESIKKRLLDFDSTLVAEIRKTWDALNLGDKQSNIDMVEGISTKLRSMGIAYEGDVQDINSKIKDRELVEAMTYSEHLRWMTERLVTGYRPLMEFEYQELVTGRNSKDYYKKCHRAHLDICSNERLAIVDKMVIRNDRDVIENIPLLLSCAQWLNAMRLTQTSHKERDNILRAMMIHEQDCLSFRYVRKGTTHCGKDMANEHSYWIADAPLTRYQWYLVTGKNKPAFRERDMPVVDISKNDIEDFLLILRKKTGLYFTLPNLAEWEYAARCSTGYLKNVPKEAWNQFLQFSSEGESSPRRARANRKQQQNELGVYDMLGNVWEWTSEEVDKHENCFYFCGGSWRFKQVECNMGQGRDKFGDDYKDEAYWYSYWAPSLASDDIGCRLIWKFDVSESQAEALQNSLVSHNESQMDQADLLKRWFAIHPMIDVEGGFYIQGTETLETNEMADSKIPLSWIDDMAGEDETPHHVVRISPFKVGSIPVTQELWNIVMGTDAKTNPANDIGNNYPQTQVSYRMIVDDFLPALNKLYAEPGFEYRLLTESEWEYVAKGGHTSHVAKVLREAFDKQGHLKNVEELIKDIAPYTRFSGGNDSSEVAWIDQHCVQPVARKKPIDPVLFPVYDMSGNIWEWVDDFYEATFYFTTMDDEEYRAYGFKTDPKCTDQKYSAHVFRGGSWLFGEIDCRCTRPNYWVDSDTDDDLGFRLAYAPKK